MTKRMISLVMVVAMVLTLFAGLTLTSHAAGTLVTDASTLAAGDVIVLADTGDSAYAGAMGTNKFFTSAAEADAIEITLGGSAGAWTLTTSEGTIGTSGAKALNHTGSGTTTWTISIESDGTASIASTNTSCGTIRYNTGSPRFLNYTSTTGTLVHIYKISGGSTGGDCDHADAEFTAAVPSTCTVAGTSAYWYCPDCDKYFADNNGSIGAEIATAGTALPLAEHTWVETANVPSTCTTAGHIDYSCSVCQATKSDPLPLAAHNYVNGTCSVCGAAEPSGFELTATLEDGDYILGCVKGDVADDADIGAIRGELSGTWGAYTVVTPANGLISDSADIYVWTLTNVTGGITLKNKSTGKYLSLPTGTGSGSGVPSFSDDAVTIYTSTLDATAKTFKLHPTDSSTNQLACNFGSGYGYRMYATRTQGNASGICVAIRFYKAGSSTPACDHADAEFTAAVPSTCTVAGTSAYWYCPDCDKYFADNNGSIGAEIATAGTPLELAAHNYAWDGDDAVNGQHKLVCSECGDETYEACVDGDSDGYCDVCSTAMPAVPVGGGDYELASTLEDGDYILGAVKGDIADDTEIGAVHGELSGTWGAYTVVTPSGGVIAETDAQDIFVWTLTNVTGGITLQNKSTGKYLSLPTGTGSGGGKPSFSDTAVTIYYSTLDATAKTFKLHPTDSSTNQLACNFGSGYGYRMYATRTQGNASGICVAIRFYKQAAATNTCTHDDIEFVAAVASTCTVAGNIAHWYCPDCDTYFADDNGQPGSKIAAASIALALAEHDWQETDTVPSTCSVAGHTDYECSVCHTTKSEELPLAAHTYEWDGEDAVNGFHKLVCTVCGAETSEACSDGNGDGYCDVCDCDMPEDKVFTLNTELHDGDQVVIVYTASNMALTTTASGAKLAGEDVSAAISGTSLTVAASNTTIAVLTVEMIDGDANNSFYLKSSDGKYLTSAATGNGVSFADSESDCAKWYLRNVNTTNNTVGLHNAGANYNGNYNQALEYYSGFTTYGWKDNNSAYVFSLYTIVNQAAHVHDWDQGTVTTPATCTAEGVMTYECLDCGDTREEAIPMIAHADDDNDGLCDSCGGTMYALATVLNEGDSVVIYHPVSKTALTKTASGTRLVAEAANGQSGVIAVGASSDIAVLTVEYISGSDTDFYLRDADGNYLTTGETGNSLTLEATATDYSIWTLTAVDTSNCLIINKNAAYNSYQIAVEYYTTFNGYSWKDNGDTAFYMELYTKAAAVTARDIDAGYSLSTDASIVINLHLTGLEAGDVVMIDSEEIAPKAAITGTDDVYTYAVDAKDINKTFTLTIKDGNNNPLTINGADWLDVSVRNYVTAEANDDTKGDDGETTVADVVRSMGNYGEYAKKYFTEREGGSYTIADNALFDGYAFSNTEAADLAAYAPGTYNNFNKTSGNVDVVKFYGSSLVLESKITLRFYFYAPSAVAANLNSVKVDGVNAADGTYGITGSYIYVDVEIDANELDRTPTVEVNYNNVEASISGVSALNYMAKVVAKDYDSADDNTKNLIDLVKALYVYYKYASGYFG